MLITYVFVAGGLMIIVCCLEFLIPDKAPLPVIRDETNLHSETILVPSRRVAMAGKVFMLVGIMFLSVIFAVLVQNHIAFNALEIIFAMIGVLLLVTGLKIYGKRHHLIQLKFDQTALYYRPKKWYSISRSHGRVNAASVLFSKDMKRLPYTDIVDVQIFISRLFGSYIRIDLRDGTNMTLVVMVQNDAQLQEIYEKIRQRL